MISKSRNGLSSTIIIVLVAIIILTNCFYVFLNGPKFSPDSRYYSREADLIISSNFQVDEYLGLSNASKLPAFRLVFTLFVAGLKTFLGENWAMGLLIVNLFFSSLA